MDIERISRGPIISSGVVPSPASVGALYSIDRDQWQAIHQRIGAVIAAKQIAAEVEQYVPNYAALLSACEQWNSRTFPQLVEQSVLVGMLASQISQQLAAIVKAISTLDAAAPLPPASSFIDSVRFEVFAQDAASYGTTARGLAPQVSDFVAANETADQALEVVVAELPPDWASVAGPLSTLGTAFPAVEASWGAIAAHLTALSTARTIDGTVAGLRADLETAIAAWAALAAEANAFHANMATRT